MSKPAMARFWDARAREDALFFVDNRRAYGEDEAGTFWDDGERDLARLLELLGVEVPADAVALDIGCGVGRLTRVLAERAERAERVYGLDVSAEMLERARALNPDLGRVEWLLGDGRGIPLPDASIDVCVSHVVFQHIPDPQITLGYVAEMGRVLRPGGWSAFQVSNDPEVHRRPSAWLRLRSALGRGPRGQGAPAWLGSAVDLDELRRVARASGLVVERIVGERTQFCLVLVRRV